jgi:hypothetical protein
MLRTATQHTRITHTPGAQRPQLPNQARCGTGAAQVRHRCGTGADMACGVQITDIFVDFT